ncbi:hypothetical protein BJV78DRAFT_1151658 [Lactifluus subvellereus]|nr:hypothetical protein BJV78DRAFT_1151658 [Lactifluus subvellereus]
MPRSTTSDAASLFAMDSFYVEEPESGPYINPATSEGFTSAMNAGSYQYTGAQIELASVFTCSQPERLPSMPSIEVWAAQCLEGRVHSNGTLRTPLYGTTQHKRTASSRVPTYPRTANSERPLCTICEKDFGRVQELDRHTKAKHMTPSQCLFCSMKWTRPDKIRTHLMDKHRECFSTETWEKINALRARDLVEFLRFFKLLRDTETTSASPIPSDPSLP